jgi:hypothetical protein
VSCLFSHHLAHAEVLYIEIVNYYFFSYPFQFINHNNSAVQYNITNAIEMTEVLVTTISNALCDQKAVGVICTVSSVCVYSLFCPSVKAPKLYCCVAISVVL